MPQPRLLVSIPRASSDGRFYGRYPSGNAPIGFQPAGYYLPRVLPLTLEFPQTTVAYAAVGATVHDIAGPYAAQFWAYLDGVNDWVYSLPIVPRGGSSPYIFELVSGPPGMAFGLSSWPAADAQHPNGWTPAQVLAAGYGRLIWHPLGNVDPVAGWSGTVWVRVYSQEYQTDPTQFLDLIFPLQTVGVYTLATGSGFLFASQSRGVGSTTTSGMTPAQILAAGYGTWADPLQDLPQFYGGLTSLGVPNTTFPSAILGLLDGVFNAYDQASTNSGIQLDPRFNPMAIIGNPATGSGYIGAVNPIQISIAECTNANAQDSAVPFGTYTKGADRFFQGFQFTGAPNTDVNAMRYFGDGYGCDRQTFDLIGAPNVYTGTLVSQANASLISLDDAGHIRYHVVVNGCWETNRKAIQSGTNNQCIHDLFSVNGGVTQFCSSTGNASAGAGYDLKGGIMNYCMRDNLSQSTGLGAMQTGCYFFNTAEANIEIEYNIFDNPNGASVRLNTGGNAALIHWVRRNTVIGAIGAGENNNGANTGGTVPAGPAGPFNLFGNAIEYGTSNGTTPPSPVIYVQNGSWKGGALPANIVDPAPGNECEAASGVVDSNYNLTPAFAQYQFTRGARRG